MADREGIAVAVEAGAKRTVASAIDWPGWARAGRDEDAALRALVDHAPRFARAISSAGLAVPALRSASGFVIAERLTGNSGTDYGIPAMALADDAGTLDSAELQRLESILSACWEALEGAAAAAHGKALRKGPRGGGRELVAILEHVVDAHSGYLSMLGFQAAPRGSQAALEYIVPLREASHEALKLAVAHELPTVGPRGGKRWTPRYFVRRAAWHILDHAWEIEDRAI